MDLSVLPPTSTGHQLQPVLPCSSGEGQACTLTITFKPGAVGKRTGTLGATSDVPKKGTVKAMLKGKGI
jgi:hypothetical protein